MKKLAILAAAAFPLLLLILVDLIRSEDDFTASSPQLFDHSSVRKENSIPLLFLLSLTFTAPLSKNSD